MIAFSRAAGVNMESQEAYELAQKGLLRPVAKEAGQVVYGMRCINFKPPNFTLGGHLLFVNEKELCTTHKILV